MGTYMTATQQTMDDHYTVTVPALSARHACQHTPASTCDANVTKRTELRHG